MNTIVRRATLAVAAAFLTTGLAACGEDAQGPAQPNQELKEQTRVTSKSPTPCDDYLRGWERARCNL